MQMRPDRARDRWLRAMENVLEQLSEAHSEAVEEAEGAATLFEALLRRERDMAKEEVEGPHGGGERLDPAVAHGRHLRDALREVRSFQTIRRPEVSEWEARVEGCLLDPDGRRLEALQVFLADAQGNRLLDLGSAEIQESGYFGLVVDEDRVASIAADEIAAPRGLVVCSPQGEIVSEHPWELGLEAGVRINLGRVLIEVPSSRKVGGGGPRAGGREPGAAP